MLRVGHDGGVQAQAFLGTAHRLNSGFPCHANHDEGIGVAALQGLTAGAPLGTIRAAAELATLWAEVPQLVNRLCRTRKFFRR